MWAARDDYGAIVLDRDPRRLEAFLASHQAVPLDADARLSTRRLLELQRNRMLMYTSCGWFFDEISGLEPVQILKYAAIVMQYLRDLGGPDLEPELERRLAAAPSNAADFVHGGEVYRRLVTPLTTDLRRVVAHYAITGLFTEYPDQAAIYSYRVERLDETRQTGSGTVLRVAHVRVESTITGEARDVMYAVLHVGGHDVSCALRAWEGRAPYDRMKNDLLARYARYSLADMVRGIDEHFPGETFGLPNLFLDERRLALARVIASVLARHEETYRRIWEENRGLIGYLRRADVPIPDALAIIARHVLEQEVSAEVAAARTARTAARSGRGAPGRGARAGADPRPRAGPSDARADAGSRARRGRGGAGGRARRCRAATRAGHAAAGSRRQPVGGAESLLRDLARPPGRPAHARAARRGAGLRARWRGGRLMRVPLATYRAAARAGTSRSTTSPRSCPISKTSA